MIPADFLNFCTADTNSLAAPLTYNSSDWLVSNNKEKSDSPPNYKLSPKLSVLKLKILIYIKYYKNNKIITYKTILIRNLR